MVVLIDLTTKEHIIEAETEHEKQLSSDDILTVRIVQSEINQHIIGQIGANWRVSGVTDESDKNQYIVTQVSKVNVGSSIILELQCITLMIHRLSKMYYYLVHEGEFSLNTILNNIFKDTGFIPRIIGDVKTGVKMEFYGDGQNRVEILKEALELWELEFIINGEYVDFYAHASRKVDYILSDDLNMRNVTVQEDATEFYTVVRAYGDINDGEPLSTAGVSLVYEHPLASNSMIGKLEAPPLRLINNEETSSDANVIKEKLRQAAKDLVDNSLKLTFQADFLHMPDFPYANPRIADEVIFEATNMDYTTTVRIISIKTKRNGNGDIVEMILTFGDAPIWERHQANLDYAAKFVSDITSGKKQISKGMLDSAMQVATQLLMNVRTELKFTEFDGILAENRDNPDEKVFFNSRGLLISNGDEPQLAITGSGIVADAITSGKLDTKLITIEGTTGAFVISGDALVATDPNNPKKKVEIRPGTVTTWGGGFTAYRPDGVTSMTNGMLDNEYAIYAYDPPFISQNASGVNRIWQEGPFYVSTKGIYDEVGDYYTQNAYRFKHTGRYLLINFYVKVNNGAGIFVKVEEFATPAGITSFEPTAKGFVYNAAEPYGSFKIDLGRPTKKERSFYIKIKGNSQGTANSQFGVRFTKMALDE